MPIRSEQMQDKSTILIVDDSPTIAEVFQHYLEYASYKAHIAECGEKALQLVAEQPLPDLILMDVMMPGIDGFETCRRLKDNETTKDIPVLFFSGSTMKIEDKLRGFEVGGLDYIDKDGEMEEILARIGTHLTIRRQQQQLREHERQLEDTLQRLETMQQQLIVQEKLASLGELVAGIAHEIKNPLNFVCSSAQIIQEFTEDLKAELEKEEPDQEELEYLLHEIPDAAKDIKENGDRAVRIIQGMLAHSRGEKGSRTLTNINLLVQEYVKLSYHGMRAQDQSFNAAIESEYDSVLDTQEINIVPQDISRVVLNIASNAFQAMRAKYESLNTTNGYTPTFFASTQDAEKFVKILLRDNGPGISAEIQEKIFEPFFTTKPTGEGTGLGLSLSYDIICKEHAGEMSVRSKEGQYTEFTILLPKDRLTNQRERIDE